MNHVDECAALIKADQDGADDPYYGWFDARSMLKENGYEVLEDQAMVDQGRWMTFYRSVVSKGTDKFVGIGWGEASTEMSGDGEPIEFSFEELVSEPSVKYVKIKK